MKKLILLTTAVILLPLTSVLAQTATVKKVKGTQAIVEFPQGLKPYVGQTLSVGDAGGDDSGGGGGGGSRANTIALSGAFTSTTVGSASISVITLSGKYGWNFGDYEFGGQGSFGSTSVAGTSSSSFGLGGFFDYNLIPNVNGTDMVYGLGVTGEFESGTSGSASTTNMEFFGGGVLKWFFLQNTVALRADAGMIFGSQSSGSVSNSLSGFMLMGGLQVYY